MNAFILGNLNNIVQIGVLLYVSYRNLRNLQRRGPWVPAVLYMFILVTMLATGFYWVTHVLMTGEYLYGFSAMDIGEIGIFLLLAAMLGASFDEPLPRDLPALAAALLFSLGNAALWGAWRGAWVRDMIAGLFLTILVYTLIRGLNRTESMDRKEWTAFGIGSAGIFLLLPARRQRDIPDLDPRVPGRGAAGRPCHDLRRGGRAHPLPPPCFQDGPDRAG